MNWLKYIYIILFTLTICFSNQADASAAPSTNNKFTIVVDAGHGGKDAGACENNVKEKDINLGVALKLQQLIDSKLKGAKCVLTRNNDTFLSLQERADKANKSGGNIFISIHTNSLDKTNPNRSTIAGSSVYVLGLHKDQNNMNVARRENSVINLERDAQEVYEGFDPQKDESYIIFELAQKKNLSQSYKFANDVQNQLVKIAGRGNRGVHQAGFWVLWATSMPSILVELDFITNPNSAKYIASEEGQSKLAEAIFKAVENYYNNQQTASIDLENIDNISPEEAEPVQLTLLSNTAQNASSKRDKAEQSVTASTRMPLSTHSTVRKRRSDYARELSDSRKIETGEIRLCNELQFEETTRAAGTPKNQTLADENIKSAKSPKNDNHKKNNKKDKKSKDAKKSEVKAKQQTKTVVKPSPLQQKLNSNSTNNNTNLAVSTTSNDSKAAKTTTVNPENAEHKKRAKLQHLETVYQIRLLQSPRQLSYSNPAFCGYRPDASYLENNLYNYTIGEATNRNALDNLYNEIKSKIPGAVMIKRTRSVNN